MARGDDLYERLRAALPTAKFFPPATEMQIARVEGALATPFPKWLRQLYLKCNGIRSGGLGDAYLMALESNDDFDQSVLSWNEFLREQEDMFRCEAKESGDDWQSDDDDPRGLLMIGTINAIEWAVDPKTGLEIYLHDVRNPGRERIADDLVEACIKEEAQDAEIVEELTRGRTPYRIHAVENPAQRDIDRIFLAIDYLHMGKQETGNIHSPWSINKATSQREGEKGELYIIRYGSDHVRLFSLDGNFPFVIRLKNWDSTKELSFIAWMLKDAVFKIMSSYDLLHPLRDEDGNPTVPDMEALRQLWHYRGMPRPDLEALADVLCARDDRRREEENQLG